MYFQERNFLATSTISIKFVIWEYVTAKRLLNLTQGSQPKFNIVALRECLGATALLTEAGTINSMWLSDTICLQFHKFKKFENVGLHV